MFGRTYQQKGTLILEDGAEFEGVINGDGRDGGGLIDSGVVEGEVVFTTGMTGYPQALTDPSFRGQILVSTYPLIGNYGIPLRKGGIMDADVYGIPIHFESGKIQVAGFVVSEVCEEPSHYSSGISLPLWLRDNGVPLLSGIDTRALTKRLRERGVMRGRIIVDSRLPETGKKLPSTHYPLPTHLVASVSRKEVKRYAPADGGSPRIVLIDCGAKANILRCLLSRGAEVISVPWDYDLSTLEYDGLFLSNGPGDPKSCGKTIAQLRKAFTKDKPIFGICLGVQLMALAAGADTYKLPYGHRSANQPCIETLPDGSKGRCYITSQNHGYAVRAETLPHDWEVWFTNVNDGTVEGIRSKTAPWSAVQFHPEGCPGPRDTEFLIDRFLETVRKK